MKERAIQSTRGGPVGLEARIINAIQKVGPKNVSLLSRITGAHAETIRYKLKRQFRSLGFRIEADVDYEKLGLVQHWAELRVSRQYSSRGGRLVSALHDLAFLTYSAKVVPQGVYVCVFSIPPEASSELRGLLAELQRVGVLESFSLSRLVQSRRDPMIPAFFNFQSGRWDIDWGKVESGQARPLPLRRSDEAADVDLYDLMLMKELEEDALQHIVRVARKLKVHQKTLEYHYRTHVQKRKLIPSYHMRWMGDPKSKAPSIMLTCVMFSGAEDDLQRVQRAVSKVPFLWSEYLTESGAYTALLPAPLKEVVTLFSYISDEVPSLNGGIQLGCVNLDDSTSFAVPLASYDKGWVFDPRAKTKVTRLVKGSS